MQVGEQTMRNRDENLLEVYRISHELLSANLSDTLGSHRTRQGVEHISVL